MTFFFKYIIKVYLPTGPLQGISETASAAEAKRKKIKKKANLYLLIFMITTDLFIDQDDRTMCDYFLHSRHLST